MKKNSELDLTPYRSFFGLTMLQFLGALMVIGIAGEIIVKFLF